MTDPRQLLDAYAGEFGEREDYAPSAFAALRAVLDLHQPYEPYRDTPPDMFCAGCKTHVTMTPWPCATVKSITDALEAK
jgi:hypothetical protein